jgi:hypothetical protein
LVISRLLTFISILGVGANLRSYDFAIEAIGPISLRAVATTLTALETSRAVIVVTTALGSAVLRLQAVISSYSLCENPKFTLYSIKAGVQLKAERRVHVGWRISHKACKINGHHPKPYHLQP